MMIDHGQPIDAWAKDQKGLTADDRASIAALVGVRTVGDLIAVLDDLPRGLAGKVRKVLGNE